MYNFYKFFFLPCLLHIHQSFWPRLMDLNISFHTLLQTHGLRSSAYEFQGFLSKLLFGERVSNGRHQHMFFSSLEGFSMIWVLLTIPLHFSKLKISFTRDLVCYEQICNMQCFIILPYSCVLEVIIQLKKVELIEKKREDIGKVDLPKQLGEPLYILCHVVWILVLYLWNFKIYMHILMLL